MRLKVGVIGCGKIAESNHLPALLNIPEVTIPWLYDKDPARAALLSAMYGLPVAGVEELDQAIRDTDVCLLTIPYGARREYIGKCAAENKALYVEKPFAVSCREHLEYSNSFPAHKLAVGFQRRYYQTVNVVKWIIDQQLFGKLNSIVFNQGYFQLKGGGGFMSDARMSGGGVLIESAIHSLDLLLQLTAASDVEVRFAGGIIRNGIDYDTRFSSNITMDGRMIEVQCHVSCLRNLDNGITMQFDHAVLHFHPSPHSELAIRSHNGEVLQLSDAVAVRPGSSYSSTVAGSFLLFWKDFISAIESGKANMTSGVNSLITTRWVEQVYQRLGRK